MDQLVETADRKPFELSTLWGPIVSTVNRLRLFLGCLRVVKNPYDTDLVIRSAMALATPERFERALSFQKSLPGGQNLFRDKPLVELPSLPELRNFPEGTLGRVYAEHLDRNGLNPDFFSVPFHDDISYTFYRYGKVHDLWHVVTGFDTSVRGEIAILAFSYAQLRGPGLAMIAALGLLHGAFFRWSELPEFMSEFHRGQSMGLKAEPLLAVNWNDLLSLPLEDVRKRLRIDS